ncbi:MAG: hypothetical protein C7B43_21505 [Sulfobacillus benefaciens]|uniref:Uncharacterized protein n=1 Tax=Sulfobacillus benefaciens TaxID=453960 RepID=A0A2T2WFT3_9FIRM|nr:MAG: hypothetical protein C7B43_21505 [Sulfobacillus benefaciens]
MAGILESAMLWRGYNTLDPNNSYYTLAGNGNGAGLTFTQPVNRVMVTNYGNVAINVKFGESASNTNYDIVLTPKMGLAISANFAQIGLWAPENVVVGVYGLREDNTAI